MNSTATPVPAELDPSVLTDIIILISGALIAAVILGIVVLQCRQKSRRRVPSVPNSTSQDLFKSNASLAKQRTSHGSGSRIAASAEVKSADEKRNHIKRSKSKQSIASQSEDTKMYAKKRPSVISRKSLASVHEDEKRDVIMALPHPVAPPTGMQQQSFPIGALPNSTMRPRNRQRFEVPTLIGEAQLYSNGVPAKLSIDQPLGAARQIPAKYDVGLKYNANRVTETNSMSLTEFMSRPSSDPATRDTSKIARPANKGGATSTMADKRKVFALPGFLQLNSLDDVVLIQRIAEGGLGMIWRAEAIPAEIIAANGGNAAVAVKMMTFDDSDETVCREMMDTFRQEVTIMHAMSPHPNIIRVLAYAESEPCDFIIITALHAADLRSLIHTYEADNGKKKYTYRMSVDDRALILMGIVEAFAFLHQHGVVHNDIKPANVLVDLRNANDIPAIGPSSHSYDTYQRLLPSARYTPIVCDFGLSTLHSADTNEGSLSADNVLEKYGTKDMFKNDVAPVNGRAVPRLKGVSVRYASPESLVEFYEASRPSGRKFPPKKFEIQCKSDVYSYGVLMWELLERKVPYGDIHEALVADLVTSGKCGPLRFSSKSEEEYLTAWHDASTSCLARDPDKRPLFVNLLKTLDEILRSKVLTRSHAP